MKIKLRSSYFLCCIVSCFFATKATAQWNVISTFSGTIKDICFTSADTGYATGLGWKTRKTVNGGNTWTISDNSDFEALVFTSDNVGYLAGANQTINKTINAGLNWQNQSLGSGASFFDLSFPSANIGYAVGNNGIIKKTVNGGNNWVTLNSTSTTFNSDFFVNDSVGFLAGNSGVIVKTINGGVYWLNQNYGNYDLFGIYFNTPLIGYAVGSDGTILKTTNGGNSWIAAVKITHEELHDVVFVNADTGYVVGNKGTILKTMDAGATWKFQFSGLTDNLSCISFPDSITGYIGASGKILKTTNGGGAMYTCSPVYITSQPVAAYSNVGKIATFSISAQGAGPYDYRWYKNGVLIHSTLSSPSQTNNFSIPCVSAGDIGSTFYCEISNRCSDNTTSQAISDTVSLLLSTTCTPVSAVTTSLGNALYYLGNTGNGNNIFNFTMIVSGTPPFIYQWYYVGSSTPFRTDTLVSTSSTYTIDAAFYAQPKYFQFYCKVSNCVGCGFGGGSTNSVFAYGSLRIECPYAIISQQPQSQTKTICETATFSISLSFFGSPLAMSWVNYSWYKNGIPIPGANSTTYTTPALTLADNGNTYSCYVGNSCMIGGSLQYSNLAILTITQPLVFSQQPMPQNLTPGNTATFTTTVTGPPPYTYSWYTNGVLSSTTQNTTSTSSSYTTPVLSPSDINNNYYCVVSNGAGCYSDTTDTLHFFCANFHSVALTGCDSVSLNNQTYTQNGDYVQVITDSLGCDSVLNIHVSLLGINNSITQQPQDLSFQPGNAASFTTSLNGNPPFTYYWFKNGVVVDSLLASSNSSATFSIPALSPVDIGSSYSCIVILGGGCDTLYSDTAHLICTTSDVISQVVCDSISINGQSYTSSGLYVQTLSNSWGCDSILTIHLTVTNLVDSVFQIGNALSSSISGVSYQWLDCEAAFLAIPGATSQTFIPLLNRYYAVAVYQGLCIDTSACFNVTFVGTQELEYDQTISIFPIPVKNVLQISSASVELSEINFYNFIGALLIQEKQSKKQVNLDLSSYAKGIYYVEIKTEKGIYRKKVITE